MNLKGEGVRDLPAGIHEVIARYGLRNSCRTAITSTGTIKLLANNASSGLE